MTKTLLGLAITAALAASAQDFQWSGSIPAGKAIEIKGINGDIRAEPSMGGSVEVTAVKTAKRSNPLDVHIDVIPTDNGITICAVYPGDGNRCGGGKDGKMNTRDNDVQVEFKVKVPAGVNFIGRSVNGDVEAKGLQSDVVAHTVNGTIRAATRGVVQGHTVNGNVEVAMGTVPTKALEFHTVNGSIEIAVPGGMGAEMDAHTVNGSINSDLPMQVRGTMSKREVKATIGGGGPELKLHTVNGSIRIKKS
jgi:DUF4097 and DUF4098 domain-containing protein YvlB